jgi:hypothetical protein
MPPALAMEAVPCFEGNSKELMVLLNSNILTLRLSENGCFGSFRYPQRVRYFHYLEVPLGMVSIVISKRAMC